MKIISVDVMELKPRNNPRWRLVVCRINTDEGLYGYGEAAMAYGVGASAAFGMIKDLSRMIIDKDPLDNEVIWDRLYKATFWGQNGGPVIFSGISAIDLALWDIKGKAFNVPVYRLLGGKRREKLRSYASQLQFGWDDGLTSVWATKDYAAVARKAVAEGYEAIKIDFFTYDRDGKNFSSEEATRLLKPYYLNLIEERIAAVREAIGPQVDIIIEAHSVTDAQAAIQIGKRAEKYNIFAYEEPTAYDVSVQAHVCASPLSTAAALHLEAVIPNFCIHEHHVINLASFNKELCLYDYQPVDGYIGVPENPGLGNELSPYALETADRLTISRPKK